MHADRAPVGVSASASKPVAELRRVLQFEPLGITDVEWPSNRHKRAASGLYNRGDGKNIGTGGVEQ